MANEARQAGDQTSKQSTKRPWVAPQIDIAPARNAEAFGGPPGAIDYGFYS